MIHILWFQQGYTVESLQQQDISLQNWDLA